MPISLQTPRGLAAAWGITEAQPEAVLFCATGPDTYIHKRAQDVAFVLKEGI